MSRLILDLLPQVKEKCVAFLAACEQAGYKMCVTQTLRTYAEQDALYAQGRTTPGKIVTYAKGGQSFHCFQMAWDCVPFKPPVHHELWWDAPMSVWMQIGKIAGDLGIIWGGLWPHPKTDLDHFEFTMGKTLAELKQEHSFLDS